MSTALSEAAAPASPCSAVVHDCLRYRIILSYEANAEGITTHHVINELVTQVAVA